MKHDIESYIITIKRKDRQSTAAESITPAATAYVKRLADGHESPGLHEPQAPYSAASGDKPAATSAPAITEVTAPLPGIIIGISVSVGEQVHEGRELAVLEAMKMENSIESPLSGTVRSISVSVGDSVSEGTVLMTID